MKQLLPESEEVTVAWIDKYVSDLPKLRARIEENHRLADALRGTKEAYRVDEVRRQAKAIEKRIEWRTRRIASLGARLGELRTLELPHMEDTYAPTTNVDRNPF